MKKFLSSSAAVIFVLAALGLLFYRYIYMPRVDRVTANLKEISENFLITNIIVDPALIVSRNNGKVLDITARMPRRYDYKTLEKAFLSLIPDNRDMGVKCSEVKTDKSESVVVEIESPFSRVCKFRFVRNFKPKIAIILDDWGYGAKSLPYLSSIKQVYTAAVLPGLKYSKKAAEQAHVAGKGVMLHLPMQPERKMPLEKETIMAGMSQGEITRIVDKLAGEIPYITGVNNHQGSLVTENKETMRGVLTALKEKGYFFIDSLTSGKTVAYKTALEMGVKAGKRNVFIDNKKEAAYNEVQINQVKAIAKKQGWAIGIGHDDEVTLETLKRMMPEIEAEGFEFVYVAELLQ